MLPLFDRAPGCVPSGQGVIVPGLVSETEDRDGLPHRDGRAPDCRPSQHRRSNEAGQIVDARHAEPGGAGWQGDVYPRRDPGAGSGRGMASATSLQALSRSAARQTGTAPRACPATGWSATQSTSPTWRARCRAWTPPGCLRAHSISSGTVRRRVCKLRRPSAGTVAAAAGEPRPDATGLVVPFARGDRTRPASLLYCAIGAGQTPSLPPAISLDLATAGHVASAYSEPGGELGEAREKRDEAARASE